MSFKLMAQAMDINVGNATRKLVLLKLCDQANDNGNCYPSYQTIATACETSKRTVQTHISTLEKYGFIRIQKRYDHENQRNFSNVYHITLENGNKDIPLKDRKTSGGSENIAPPPSENSALGSENIAPPPSANISLGGENISPKPINEPINIEPINESISEKPKTENSQTEKQKTKKRKTDFVEFQFTDKQKSKAEEYGLNLSELLDVFKDTHQSKGNKFVDWSLAFNTWIANHISWNKLKPLSQQTVDTYSQQVSHPSHQQFAPSQQPQRQQKQANEPKLPDHRKFVHYCGEWFKPLAGMKTTGTHSYIMDRCKREGIADIREGYHKFLEKVVVEKVA